MKKSEYGQMAHNEKTYWWHIGRLSIVDAQLQSISSRKTKLRILNVGCGTGGTIKTLEKYGIVTNIDTSKEALKYMKLSGHDGILINTPVLPFKDESFDVVVALDVLEHIENDQTALLEWRRVLKESGKVLITVPAYQWLWSGHDESLHHWRRYTTSKLRWDLDKVSFNANKVSYAIAFSLPLVAGFRVLHKLTRKTMTDQSSYVQLPGSINSFFSALLKLEAIWLSRFSLPFGTTVLGIFSKHR